MGFCSRRRSRIYCYFRIIIQLTLKRIKIISLLKVYILIEFHCCEKVFFLMFIHVLVEIYRYNILNTKSFSLLFCISLLYFIHSYYRSIIRSTVFFTNNLLFLTFTLSLLPPPPPPIHTHTHYSPVFYPFLDNSFHKIKFVAHPLSIDFVYIVLSQNEGITIAT